MPILLYSGGGGGGGGGIKTCWPTIHSSTEFPLLPLWELSGPNVHADSHKLGV